MLIKLFKSQEIELESCLPGYSINKLSPSLSLRLFQAHIHEDMREMHAQFS